MKSAGIHRGKAEVVSILRSVYEEMVGKFNHVYISTNKIATVFGRSGFYRYIQNEVRKGNLEKIKNRSNSSSELTAPIAADYVKNASAANIIRTNEAKSQDKNSQRNTLSESALLNDEMEAREKERMEADVALKEHLMSPLKNTWCLTLYKLNDIIQRIMRYYALL